MPSKWVTLLPMRPFTRDGANAVAIDGVSTVDGDRDHWVLYPFLTTAKMPSTAVVLLLSRVNAP